VLANVVCAVDYAIPTGNPTKRVDFYRKVHRLLRQHYGKDVNFSTQSCYFTEDNELAKKFLELVQTVYGQGHIYKAVKVQ
jgi:hypothetical protein